MSNPHPIFAPDILVSWFTASNASGHWRSTWLPDPMRELLD